MEKEIKSESGIKPSKNVKNVAITAPNFEVAGFDIIGDAPYVQLKFSEKTRNQLLADMSKPKVTGGKKKVLPARNYSEEFENAQYREAVHGWNGIPAASFRAAAIRAAKLCGMDMTLAKCTIFVIADGYDADGTPLVKIDGEPELFTSAVRNSGKSVDIRVRAKFWPWKARINMRYDADHFSLDDVTNLLMRIGMQVGIGEGRPNAKSSSSAGMGWGTFQLG